MLSDIGASVIVLLDAPICPTDLSLLQASFSVLSLTVSHMFCLSLTAIFCVFHCEIKIHPFIQGDFITPTKRMMILFIRKYAIVVIFPVTQLLFNKITRVSHFFSALCMH